MNANQMINMVIRMVMRQVMRRGVNAGMDAVGKRMNRNAAQGEEGAGQRPGNSAGAAQTQKRMRQGMRTMRRMGRF